MSYEFQNNQVNIGSYTAYLVASLVVFIRQGMHHTSYHIPLISKSPEVNL